MSLRVAMVSHTNCFKSCGTPTMFSNSEWYLFLSSPYSWQFKFLTCPLLSINKASMTCKLLLWIPSLWNSPFWFLFWVITVTILFASDFTTLYKSWSLSYNTSLLFTNSVYAALTVAFYVRPWFKILSYSITPLIWNIAPWFSTIV